MPQPEAAYREIKRYDGHRTDALSRLFRVVLDETPPVPAAVVAEQARRERGRARRRRRRGRGGGGRTGMAVGEHRTRGSVGS